MVVFEFFVFKYFYHFSQLGSECLRTAAVFIWAKVLKLPKEFFDTGIKNIEGKYLEKL